MKSKVHGYECLRCGMKGDIRYIKAEDCRNPTGTPKYPEGEKEETAKDDPFKRPRWKDFVASRNELVPPADADMTDTSGDTLDYIAAAETTEAPTNQSMLDEIKHLQKLEEELALLVEIQEQQELLEALEMEELMEQVDRVVGSEQDVDQVAHTLGEQDVMIKKLVNMNFPEEIASWAVGTSKGDWETTLEKARKKFQESQEVMARPPATPCNAQRSSVNEIKDTNTSN